MSHDSDCVPRNRLFTGVTQNLNLRCQKKAALTLSHLLIIFSGFRIYWQSQTPTSITLGRSTLIRLKINKNFKQEIKGAHNKTLIVRKKTVVLDTCQIEAGAGTESRPNLPSSSSLNTVQTWASFYVTPQRERRSVNFQDYYWLRQEFVNQLNCAVGKAGEVQPAVYLPLPSCNESKSYETNEGCKPCSRNTVACRSAAYNRIGLIIGH